MKSELNELLVSMVTSTFVMTFSRSCFSSSFVFGAKKLQDDSKITKKTVVSSGCLKFIDRNE